MRALSTRRRTDDDAAFEVLKRRWIVARAIVWLGRNRRMSKDYEFLTETSESLINAAMSRLMLKRLTKGAKKQRNQTS